MNTEIDSIAEYVRVAQTKHNNIHSDPSLPLDAAHIIKRCRDLHALLPESVDQSNLSRHAHFIEYWLKEQKPDRCMGDFDDILKHDLPQIKKSLTDWAHGLKEIDGKFREALIPLIRIRNLDSAIRKAFVMLKDRLCDKYHIDKNVDGEDLINKLFGKSSKLIPGITDEQRSDYRNLFAGLFGLMRNKFAHEDVEASFEELDFVIVNINHCLRVTDAFEKPISGAPL